VIWGSEVLITGPVVSSKAWKLLCGIEPLRHRLVHGFKAIDPARMKAATSLLLLLVEDHDWLESVPLVDAKRQKDRILVGSLLSPTSSASKR